MMSQHALINKAPERKGKQMIKCNIVKFLKSEINSIQIERPSVQLPYWMMKNNTM